MKACAVKSPRRWARSASSRKRPCRRLRECLKDAQEGVRADAARALGAFGAKGRAASSALRELLKDPDDGVRVQAAEALWRIDHHASNVLTVLTFGPEE